MYEVGILVRYFHGFSRQRSAVANGTELAHQFSVRLHKELHNSYTYYSLII